ncbi:AraC family transcriptional regulator [Streptomyces sp. CB02923]|uniref:helix-turn-helix transcriptional regulator n=1 Tax=Streptomyces sp. CB02923 TaxID=1718985 RepID=UPI00093A58C6|nr:AraC family transcriptional regulator [Streptomyces sp. CB02923]OKI01372.1 AraC family transcriptional regulator [Streptomyces sp. CB02923]
MHRLDVPAPHLLPFAIGSFDTIGPLSRAGFPHRHSFHEIVYVTGGTGTHVLDEDRRPLCPPHLCFITPGQVHYWDRVSGLRGWVILFTDDFLLAHPGDRDALTALGERPWTRPGPDDAARLAGLVGEMLREYDERAPSFTSVLQAQLHILIARALRMSAPRDTPGPAGASGSGEAEGPSGSRRADFASGRAALVAREFTRLLAQPGSAGRSVRSYADELGVSVGHLAELVKRSTGRTPGQLIRHAQTVEAKRLLSGSGLTVAQVARRVGFGDPAYFCRFFRRETGLSPGDFRRAADGAGGIHHDLRAESIEAPRLPE